MGYKERSAVVVCIVLYRGCCGGCVFVGGECILHACNDTFYSLAKWQLKPLSLNQYTITDTFGFTNEIHELKINKSEILVSYDVSSLFTNVPLDETLQ